MPSEKHNTLSRMAIAWINNKVTGRGIRGGFEVSVAEGYVADAVVLCSFQQRYAERFIGKENFERLSDFTYLIPEVLCVFEAKATRADFQGTFGGGERQANRHEPVGSLHWCVTPRKLVLPEELPDFWGLLQTRGLGLEVVRRPVYYKVNDRVLEKAAYQILWYAKEGHKRYGRCLYKDIEE